MTRRVLVAYATSMGSTTDVAATIGAVLCRSGFDVDVRPLKDNPSVAAYGTVVIGSAVQHGTCLMEAVDFVKDNQQALSYRSVALFCVHITNLGDDETSTINRHTFLNELRAYVDPIDEGFFAGRFNRQYAGEVLPSWAARWVPTMDFRNWDKIETWAYGLAMKLKEVNQPVKID